MARKVMARVMKLIKEEPAEIAAYLHEVLKIERVHQANADTGVKEKLQAELERVCDRISKNGN